MADPSASMGLVFDSYASRLLLLTKPRRTQLLSSMLVSPARSVFRWGWGW